MSKYKIINKLNKLLKELDQEATNARKIEVDMCNEMLRQCAAMINLFLEGRHPKSVPKPHLIHALQRKLEKMLLICNLRNAGQFNPDSSTFLEALLKELKKLYRIVDDYYDKEQRENWLEEEKQKKLIEELMEMDKDLYNQMKKFIEQLEIFFEGCYKSEVNRLKALCSYLEKQLALIKDKINVLNGKLNVLKQELNDHLPAFKAEFKKMWKGIQEKYGVSIPEAVLDKLFDESIHDDGNNLITDYEVMIKRMLLKAKEHLEQSVPDGEQKLRLIQAIIAEYEKQVHLLANDHNIPYIEKLLLIHQIEEEKKELEQEFEKIANALHEARHELAEQKSIEAKQQVQAQVVTSPFQHPVVPSSAVHAVSSDIEASIGETAKPRTQPSANVTDDEDFIGETKKPDTQPATKIPDVAHALASEPDDEDSIGETKKPCTQPAKKVSNDERAGDNRPSSPRL